MLKVMERETKSNIVGIAYIVLYLVIFGLCIALFFSGQEWILTVFIPTYSYIVTIGIIAGIISLPLALFKKTRTISGNSLLIVSYVIRLWVWLISATVVCAEWGTWIMLAGSLFLGVGVVPMAAIIFALGGYWNDFITLVIWSVAALAVWSLGYYIMSKTYVDN